MKAPSQEESGGPSHRRRVAVATALLAAAVSWAPPLFAEEPVPGSPPANTPGPAAPAPTAAPEQPATAPLSPGVADILKLTAAGVSAEVIRTYIDCAPTACPLTDADVIALKRGQVPDDVVTRLIQRGAEARTAVAQANHDALAQALSERRLASGGFDPESYEYFQYYHLQARTLATSRQRLGYYAGPGYHYPGFYAGPRTLNPWHRSGPGHFGGPGSWWGRR